MPKKLSDIAIWVSILLSAVMIVTFIATRRDVSESKLRSKAEKSYVDDQDDAIKEDMREDKIEHQTQHNVTSDLLKSMDRKIDILLTDK